MSLLRSIEERIARIVEGGFGRAFRTNVQPVELARRLTMEMDANQHRTVRKVYVPNVFEVYLSPDDHAQFEGHEKALTSELGEFLAEHARRQGYTLVTRPRVQLSVDPDLSLGAFGIASRLDESAREAIADREVIEPAGHTMVQPVAAPRPAVVVPATDTGDVTWALTAPGTGAQVLGARTTLGRGRTNDIVLSDSSVSREHAEVIATADGMVVRDLGSTNGVMVNGTKVSSQLLDPGDTVRLGNVDLKFDRAASS
jgi:hypothetical protein